MRPDAALIGSGIVKHVRKPLVTSWAASWES